MKMGRNIDMNQIFGLPETIKCERCRKPIENYCDEYDIDCGEPNPAPGQWELDIYCNECEHEFKYKFEVKIKKLK